MCRIYLLGNNEINSPWIVPMIPPRALKDRINAERYQDFVQQINGCYKNSKIEIFFSKTLPILYPVLKPLMNKFKRKERYNAFKRAFISISDKMEFWKSVVKCCIVGVQFEHFCTCLYNFVEYATSCVCKVLSSLQKL